MVQLAIFDAYQTFMAAAQPLMNIDTEEQYNTALETLECVLEFASDTLDDPLMAFVDEAESIPVDIALLRTLMRQHHLTGSDLPEGPAVSTLRPPVVAGSVDNADRLPQIESLARTTGPGQYSAFPESARLFHQSRHVCHPG
ncbi:hypothetical protein [Marinobacter sp.]|uniref:hypothetical protein n=1 Tax=Marinobacter sp. TaxID=50741 RepID=UPI001B55B681|nr:hypothetical protein [Marinobacter sp.]MBQ0833207.1 hypothetical protein [Marinobacter sp.]